MGISMTGDLAGLLGAALERDPSAPALLAPGRPDLDYRGLGDEVARAGAVLHGAGLGPGSRCADPMRTNSPGSRFRMSRRG